MSSITIIAAVGKDGELGKDNNLLWHLPEDLKFFKENTIGKPIIMGLNTFKSIPKLCDRAYIVLTHQNIDLGDDIIIFHSLDDVLNYMKHHQQEYMVIGGATVYNLMIKYADRMLLTEIDSSTDADVYFPKVNKDEWDIEELSTHEQGKIKYKHVLYKRK